jgi:CheY-like chemotaxis protein
VTDSGVGIEEKDQHQLFKPFVQITNRLSGTTKGTGLGLSIVASLLEQMGGTYGVTSTFGIGSTFYCTIPLKVDKTSSEEHTLCSRSHKTPNSSTVDIESHDLSALSPILIVDDNRLICNIVKEILNKWNIKVDIVHNGKEALDKLKHYEPEHCPYQVVLMDDMMPVMFGQTAIKQLRSDGYAVPIIGITGNIEEADKILLYGANHVLKKPITKYTLMKTLASIYEDSTTAFRVR